MDSIFLLKYDSSANRKGLFSGFFSWNQKTPASEVEDKVNTTNTNYLNEIFKSSSINIKGGGYLRTKL